MFSPGGEKPNIGIKAQGGTNLTLLVFVLGILSLTSIGIMTLSVVKQLRPVAFTAINKQLNYQGKLQNAAGITLTDGNYSMKFSIYAAASGGTPLWTECGTVGTPTARTVAVANGVFSVLLGDIASGACPGATNSNAVTLDFNSDSYYLGLTVEADEEMLPRKRLGASGYAFNADLLDGLNTSAAGGSSAFVPVTDASGHLTLTQNLTLGGVFKNAAGSAASPSYTFTGDPDTGLYSAAANNLGISAVGAAISYFSATTNYTDSFFYTPRFITPMTTNYPMTLTGRINDGATAVGVILDNSTTLSIAGAKIVSFKNNTTEKAYIDYLGSFNAGAGTVLLPAYSFVGDPNTGFYKVADDDLRLSVGGAMVSEWTTAGHYTNTISPVGAVSMSIKGAIADGATAIGNKFGNTNALTIAGAKIVSFYSDNLVTEKAYITKDGDLWNRYTYTDQLAPNTVTTLRLVGLAPDGAGAVGVNFDNYFALTLAGAKIASFRNATVEKAYIDKDGNLYGAGANLSGLTASLAVYTDASKNLTSTPPTSGAIGYWSRATTTLSPTTANDIVAITGNSGDLLTLTSTATGASNKALSIAASGATVGTDYGAYISNIGGATTKVGLYATASGATNNYAAIFDAGDVGVGTATPFSKFHVNSASVLTGSYHQILITSNDSAAIDKGGSMSFGGAYTGTTLTHWAGISGRKENVTAGNYAGYLALETRANGGNLTEQMRIDSAGKVGIGTTAPWAKLSIPFNESLSFGNADYSYSISRSSAGALVTTFADSYVDSSARVDFTMGNGSVTALSILGSGNVGIGDTTPDGKLDVEPTGAVTAANYGISLSNLTTNATTDGINKYGLYVTSTGAWTGDAGTATNNYGLYVDTVSGGDNNFSAYFAGNVQLNSLDASSIVYTDASKNLTSTPPGAGSIGYWSRATTTLSPVTANDVVSVTGSGAIAITGTSSAAGGKGIYGTATDATAVANYGGYFTAAGTGALTVGVYGGTASAANYVAGFYGTASNTGAYTNFGGVFYAAGETGVGIRGEATSTAAAINFGGKFIANGTGSGSVGVYGQGVADGAVLNYGGYFLAEGTATGASGVYGEASGAGTVYGVYGNAADSAAVTNYGGYFTAAGTTGVGVYGTATNGGYAAIFGSGNVGIGTAAPGTKLEAGVSGISVRPTSALVTFNNNATAGNSTGGYDELVLSNSGTTPDTTLRGSSISFKSTAFAGGTSSYSTGRVFSYFDTSGGVANDYADAILALQYPSADNTFANGLALRNGKVGIGTTAPTRQLTISGASQADLALVSTDQGALITDGFNLQQAGVNTVLINREAGSMSFWTNATQQMTILSSGNVGIGTTLPIYTLEVKTPITAGTVIGQGIYNLQPSSGGVALEMGYGSAYPTVNTRIIATQNASGANGSQIQIQTHKNSATVDDWNTILYGDQAGNVGIGDTTPDGKLDVEPTGAVTAASYGTILSNLTTNETTDGINKYGTYITSTGAWTGAGGTATKNYGLYVDTVSGADQNFSAYFAGNVGVGTTTPTGAKIQIESSTDGLYGIYNIIAPTIEASTTQYDIGNYSAARQAVQVSQTNSGYAMGVEAEGYLSGAGNLDTAYGIRADTGTMAGGTGTVTSAYGAYVRVLNSGGGTISNGYGLYISDVAASTDYGIYQAGASDDNYFAGNVGIGTAPTYTLDVSSTGARAINAVTSNTGGYAVYGSATATGAVTNYGGVFYAAGDSGRGIYSNATATGAVTNYGGYFSAAGNSGAGIYGTATATGAVANYGGVFYAAGNSGAGVYSTATSASGTNYGGYFIAAGTGSDTAGVYGSSTGTGGSKAIFGGRFIVASAVAASAGVYSSASGAGDVYGVYGTATDTSAVSNYGGYFTAAGDTGRGVYGSATDSGAATNYGGYFLAQGTGSLTAGAYGEASGAGTVYGVIGYASATGAVQNTGGAFTANGNTGRGVYGQGSATTGAINYGGFFTADGTGAGATGVYGIATSTGSNVNYGGWFQAAGTNARAVYGYATDTGANQTYGGLFRTDSTGGGYGVYGFANGASGTNYAVAGSSTSATGWGGYFSGGYGLFADHGQIARSPSGNDTSYGLVVQGATCIDDSSANCPSTPTSGTIYTEGAALQTFDLAELYESTEALVAGDVVSVDTGSARKILKSTGAYQNTTMGVISTDPGITLGGWSAGPNQYPVALAGRVPVKVNDENGSIAIGDVLTSSSTPGVAMRATKPGQKIGLALEAWSGVGQGVVEVFISPGWDAASAIATDGTAIFFDDDFTFNKLGEADATTMGYNSRGLTFRGSGWDGGAAQNVEMRMNNVVTDSLNYKLSVLNNAGSEIAYLDQDGAFGLSGKFYPASPTGAQSTAYIFYRANRMRTNAVGWATGSFDFAEMFLSREFLEAGDVVVLDETTNEYVKKSTTAYSNMALGIVSTEPGFLAGANVNFDDPSVDQGYPVGLAGRVPAKVSAENGPIRPGDFLATSSTPGVAMRATESGMVLGTALESFDGPEIGLIKVFINLSWYNVMGETTPIDEMAQLTLTGDLNMAGNYILNVGKIVGVDEKWSIDENGILKIKLVAEDASEKEMFGLTSAKVELTLSGIGRLENGTAMIDLSLIDPDFIKNISAETPIKVIVTLTEPANGVYVAEKSAYSFRVAELNAGTSDAAFDWIVIARRKGYEDLAEGSVPPPSEPAPAAPTEPAPSEPAPESPAPSEPAPESPPSEPAPSEPAPSEPVPETPAPSEPAPETPPSEPTPSEPAP